MKKSFFSLTRHNSIYDVLFVGLFVIALFIPMSKINETSYDKAENRTLTTFKPLINQNGTLNYDFGKDFEAWFNDRFRFRYAICNSFNILKYNLTSNIYETSTAYYNKKNHFGYLKRYIVKTDSMFTRKFMKDAVKNLDKLNGFCKTNNIKLYVVIAPLNFEIYDKEIFPKVVSSQIKRKTEILSYISNHSQASVFYPINELKKASKKHYTAYKLDHHWTDYGAFIAYKILMKKINKDFPQITPLNKNDFKIISSNQFRSTNFQRSFGNGNIIDHQIPFLKNCKNEILDAEYLHFTHKNSTILKKRLQKDAKRRIFNYTYEKGQDLKLMLMGTSVNGSLTEFLPYNFKYTKQIRLNGTKFKAKEQYKIMKHYKNEILDFKPDILVLCLTTSNLLGVNDWFKE